MTTLSGILPPVNVSTATGTLPHNKGGTGLTSAGAAGNVLTSNGDGWVSSPASGGGGSSVVISETAPASPTAGTVWWDSDTGASYIYYDDGNTAQWVSFSMGKLARQAQRGRQGRKGHKAHKVKLERLHIRRTSKTAIIRSLWLMLVSKFILPTRAHKL